MTDIYSLWIKFPNSDEWERHAHSWTDHLTPFQYSLKLFTQMQVRSTICTQAGELMSFTSGTPIEELRKVQAMEQHHDTREEYADVRQ